MGRNKKSWTNYAIVIAAVVALVIASVAWYYDFVIPSEGQIYGSCVGPLSKCNALIYNGTLYVEFFNFNSDMKNATFYFSPYNYNPNVVKSALNVLPGKPLNLSNVKAFMLEFNLSGISYPGAIYAVGYYRNGTAFNMTVATVLKPNVTTERPNISVA